MFQAIPETLLSAIGSVNPDHFLQILSAIDQEEHKSTISSLDCDQPKFYWIFKNMDFKQLDAASSQVLWLSGPPECDIHHASSYIVDLAKKKTSETRRSVLFFFCSTAVREKSKSIIAVFVHTLLYQIIYCSPMDKKIPIIKSFLHTLLEAILERERATYWEPSRFKQEDSSDTTIKKILEASPKDLWDSLKTVLADEQKRELSIVIDGLDKVERQKDEFIRGVLTFIVYLQERISKVKALLTSRPRGEIKEIFDELCIKYDYIEYDRERKGLVPSYGLTLY
jgi:ankyrin repeat domain-containing protein 50